MLGAILLPIGYLAACWLVAMLTFFSGSGDGQKYQIYLLPFVALLGLPVVLFIYAAGVIGLSENSGIIFAFIASGIGLGALGYWSAGAQSRAERWRRFLGVWISLCLLASALVFKYGRGSPFGNFTLNFPQRPR